MDGNSDGDFNNGLSCSHTNYGDTDPWWRVDLGSSQPVSEVFIVNRIHCQDRLSDMEIRVGKKLNILYSLSKNSKRSFGFNLDLLEIRILRLNF